MEFSITTTTESTVEFALTARARRRSRRAAPAGDSVGWLQPSMPWTGAAEGSAALAGVFHASGTGDAAASLLRPVTDVTNTQ